MYYGAGAVGKLAAEADALRRAERKAQEEMRRAKKELLGAAWL